MKIQSIALAALLATVSAPAAAHGEFTIGEVTMGGTGCPAGTWSVVTSDDEDLISVFFDEYLADIPEGPGSDQALVGCNLGITVNVRPGFTIGLLQLDYRGNMILPAGGTAKLSREYFFAGSRGPKMTDTMRSGTNEYEVSDALRAMVWAPCGTNPILRAKTSFLLSRPAGSTAQAYFDISSIDVAAGLQFFFRVRSC
jgi:hypothetical protein